MSILGTRVLRAEDPGLLSRGATYTEDVQDERLAGACYVHFVRSTVAHAKISGTVAHAKISGTVAHAKISGTVAHAKISGIDSSAAREADGDIAVYTGADLAAAGLAPAKPPTPNMNQAMLAPLLAIDVVRFVGEPVAVVVTEDVPGRGRDRAG